MSASDILRKYEKERCELIAPDDIEEFLANLHPDDCTAELNPEDNHFEE